ncbi:FtsW/RodA/SpoVE family cell cycle protein [Pelagibacteraceae bacterium]|nr:FtsW/RodA/SpoVE family cell cycle protein [Pelagibacteraceae bacterium]
MFNRHDSGVLAQWWRSIDKTLLFLGLALLVGGNLFNFLSTSTIASEKLYDSRYFLFYKHAFFSFVGLSILIFFSFVNKDKIKLYGIAGFIFFVLLLIFVYFFGVEVKGSKRWLNLFFFRIQPVEFVKPFLILALSLILSSSKYSLNTRFFLTFPFVFFLVALLLIQPDYSQSLLIITIWMILVFTSGIGFLFISLIGTIVALAMISILFFFKDNFFYIFDRVVSWVGEAEVSYQSEQALNAIISGGFFGRGIGEGVLKESVPEAHTDYVMSVIAEEYGIIIVLFIISITMFLVIRIFAIANNSSNNFFKISLIGISSLLALQSFINLGVTINILPSTGMPFPFISYGGSSIMGSSIALGLALLLSKDEQV